MNVYLLKQLGYTKIGKADNVLHRIKQLQTATPEPIEYIASFNTDKALELESLIHNKYSLFRSSGEWFKLSKKQVNDIITEFGFNQDSNINKLLLKCKSKEDLFKIDCFEFKKSILRLDKLIGNNRFLSDTEEFDEYKWIEFIDRLCDFYGFKITENLLKLGESFDNIIIVGNVYDFYTLDSKKVKHITSNKSKYNNYTIEDNDKNFLRAILFTYPELCKSENSIVFDKFITYFYLAFWVSCVNGKCDSNFRKSIVNMTNNKDTNIQIIKTLDLYNKNDNSTYCRNKIKKLLNERITQASVPN